ncbi:MAG: hypothetical protein N3G20_09895 [Verrucomicrobiae bacterium]|nr:hypothetical protein [Verrucomicrobiae bacterium]
MSTELACNCRGTPSFEDDVAFLRGRVDVIILSDEFGESQVAVVPAYQGRVITSTATGPRGRGFGWINRELIASGRREPHINAYGGEDRFWLGPEGGQYSIFFAPGVPFDFDHWYTPPPIDTEPFELKKTTPRSVVCSRTFAVTNYSKTHFHLEVKREVRLLNGNDVLTRFGTSIPKNLKWVAFESVNVLRNAGSEPWRPETGLLSIWILGMFNATEHTTVVIPINEGPEELLGPPVNDAYFGQVPTNRLAVKNGVVYFRADARYRSKIGVGPKRAKRVFGSYDRTGNLLTLVTFTFPGNAARYVNSTWGLQKDPYGGDVINSYNDGPATPGGKGLGNFYELETSSPALALKPDEEACHVHTTLHLHGDEPKLDEMARSVLGAPISEICCALPAETLKP